MKAKPNFQEYMELSANCPKCDAPLVLKYASNPKHSRKLSIIIACRNQCDKHIWNTDIREGFTHWWLDGTRDREGYEGILKLLSDSENKLLRQLEKQLSKINRTYKRQNLTS